MSEQPPAGWYPDSTGTTRWWDGEQWTNHTPPPPPTREASSETPSEDVLATAVSESTTKTQAPERTRADAKAEKAYAKASRPWYKKKRFIIPLALIALAIAGSALGSETSPPSADSSSSQSSDAGSTEPSAEPEPIEETEPELTAAQENAVGKAEDYLDLTSFSRTGLIKQLKFDGFSKKDATFAVEYLSPNWKKQAAEKAQEYLDLTSFSRTGLIQQLEFDGFTDKQATYGVNQTGL